MCITRYGSALLSLFGSSQNQNLSALPELWPPNPHWTLGKRGVFVPEGAALKTFGLLFGVVNDINVTDVKIVT